MSTSIGQYLLQRLHEEGVRHVFGVPGDYILRWYQQLAHSELTQVGTTREDNAAFAADAYARVHGLGALAVTYGVGALSVVNAVAGAAAESSPVVVISGAPGVIEQREHPLLHHRFGPYHFQREIFERLTCYCAVLDDPLLAARQIDRALAAARRYSKPVYLELPRDRVDTVIHLQPECVFDDDGSDPDALAEAVAETVALLAGAERGAVLAGVELHRYRQQDALAALVERLRWPVAATLSGKSVLSEQHPAYLGVYEGAMGAEYARSVIEGADILLLLGSALNDVDLGVFTAQLDPRHMIQARNDEVCVRHHRYPNIRLADFLAALIPALPPPQRDWPAHSLPLSAPGFPEPGDAMTVSRLIGRLNDTLPDDMLVVSDTGDCLFASLELRTHPRTGFLASAYYTTMGFAVPAALGAQLGSGLRPLVLVGDGAFQMTGTELSTAAWKGLNPVVIVFDNGGYSTERFILDGPFNDIAPWRLDALADVFGPLYAFTVGDEQAFDAAWQHALEHKDRPTLIAVKLAADDPSSAMRRLGESLGRTVKGG
ncbi:alpha-keto acid decarboxylase family protein [Jeongeupia naejangsanensis]|uniref:Alpha-keto acid decarboxylase family protein n=1 Tax=Jeongeupia naejangsanensis TaxID=613195 RepID=A0ABS2BJW9_9NEIS|nr:thiamine pyrophosphate-binding protein [Jeongeupia naejangsanensis]MBM3115904.1 alpha-keto acid decarboxylase family protein [Jeongeupia naejangsanensis]